MSDARRSQSRAILAFVAVVTSIGAAFGACTSYQRANGEECLKDVDCTSGFCLAQKCDNPPQVLVGPSYGGDAGVTDAGSGNDTSTSTPDSAPALDSSGGGDSATDGPPAPVDAGQDTSLNDDADGAPDLDASPDAADAPDAFNQSSRSRRTFLV